MEGKYKGVFIIPVGAKKILGEHGWEFETSSRISSELKELLIDVLKLKFLESYIGIDSYINENIKMSVFYDDQNQIEIIYFQLHGDALITLSDVFLGSKITKELELFIP